MSWFERKLKIHRLKKLERRKYRQMIQVGCFATNVGDIDMFHKSLELEREVDEIREQIAKLGSGTCKNVSDSSKSFLCSTCGWGDFAEPSHLLTMAKYTGRIKEGPNYCRTAEQK